MIDDYNVHHQVSQPVVRVSPGINISLECRVEGSPSPAVRLVISINVPVTVIITQVGEGGQDPRQPLLPWPRVRRLPAEVHYQGDEPQAGRHRDHQQQPHHPEC